MFKTSSFRSLNRPNGRRRSQNNDDNITFDSMSPSTETQSSGNAFSQRLMRPRTKHNSTCLGTSETSSTKATPINTRNDYSEDARTFSSNDSPVSFTGSATFRNSESPSRPVTVLPSEGVRSRKASFTSASSSSKRHTFAADNSDVDVAAAIALLQELKKRASPEDLILLHKALLPARNVERVIAPAKTESNESEEPISPLIRRSSLLPAGVKTRLSRELLRNYSDNNVAVRSASVSRQQRPAESPKLDIPLDFEALDLADGSIEAQGPRPTTPSEFYPQIGTYKMGSLRITNGAASPEPARLLNRVENKVTEQKSSVSESLSGDGFITADEGESSPECVRPSRATLVSLRASRRNSEQQEARSYSDVRARSKSRGPPTRRSFEAETDGSARQLSRPQVAQRASEYAQEYLSEFNTLENPHAITPALTTTVSRLSTVHDESPVEEGIDAREEALRRLTGDVPLKNENSNSQKHLNVARPPMKKSDSGYSSEASRRSIVKESHCDEFLHAALDAADQAERSRSKESAGVASARPSLEQISEDKVSSPRSPYISQQLSAVQKAERHRSLPSFFFKKSSSSTSVNTIGTTPVTPPAKQTRKLQKSRPQSQIVVPPQVQELEPEPQPEPEPEFVPGASEDLSVNFSRPTRRMERGPSASPQAKSAEEDVDIRGRGRSRKQASKSKPASPECSPEGTGRRRSRSFFRFRSRSRSKSQHRRAEEVTVLSVADEPLPSHDFSDFGTVAQSLGQSPYDIATRRVKQMGAYDPSKPWFHPHEISRAAPEPASSSELQQTRGKSVDRSEQQRARSQSRPRESIDTVISNSRPPTRGKTRRSQSAHNIAVPRVPEQVPELPKQVETMSGTFSRPVSKDGNVRVGTIDFGTGFAQGRLEPILTSTEKAKTRRRTQSVAPRARPSSAVITDEPMPQRPANQPVKEPARETAQASEAPVRELPQAPSQKPSPAPARELPQIPLRAPPRVPAHGKQPANVHPVLSVSTKPVEAKVSASAPQTPASPATWESQALAWRDRKQSINEMLSSPTVEKKTYASKQSQEIQAYSPTLQAPRRAPTVVVSRYITPQGSEFAMHLGEEGSHRKRHSEDPYKRYRSENPTDLRPAQEDVERTDSSSTYRTATSERSQDSFASNDSAKYRAYRPVETNTTPEKVSPPRSNMTQKRSSRVYEQPQQAQSQRRSMVLPEQPRPQRRSTAPQEAPDVPFDRFSGGLGYGWERGIGFGGSAGTRQKNDNKASRKSVAISQNFGVDLSDVPVFMVRN